MQVCRICKRELPDSCFCKNKGNKTGLDYRCRDCRNIESREYRKNNYFSAHLDRLDPNKGYVIGNVSWISGRANRIKYNATVEELRAIADWMERATTIPQGSTPKQVEKVS